MVYKGIDVSEITGRYDVQIDNVDALIERWEQFLCEKLGARGDDASPRDVLLGTASIDDLLAIHPVLQTIAAKLGAVEATRKFMEKPSWIVTASDEDIRDYFDLMGTDYGFMTSVSDQVKILIELVGFFQDTPTLDVGCGVSSHMTFLAAEQRLTAKLAGIDPSSMLLVKARDIMAGCGVSYPLVQGWAGTLPFDDDAFPQVMAIDSLHWIGDWRKALDECVRVTASDGKLLLVYSSHAPRRKIASNEAVSRLSVLGMDVVEVKSTESRADTPRVVIKAIKRKPSGIIIAS